MSGKTVLLLGSFAPSLVHFRGPLIASIVERGHRVIAAAPSISADVAEKLRQLGAEPRELELVNASLNPASMLQSLRQVRALIREVRPDVLIAYTVKPVVLGAIAAKAERVPRIVSLITGVGYAFTGGRELKRLISRAIATPLYRLALSRSDVVIFQNPDDEALFRDFGMVPGGRETHIVNGSGIDLDHFATAPLPERPSFLMIARLLKDKGIREFASAAKRLKAGHPEVPIALVGYLDPSPDSLAQAELDDLIQHGIDYKGRMSDVRPAISEASVYVLVQLRAIPDRCRSEERVMAARGSFRKYTAAFVAISMLGASAASAAPRTVDPLVALSVFGTSESRAAVCAAGAQAAAAAGAALAAQAAPGQAGCVLPVMDAAPPPVVTEAAPPPPAAVAPVAVGGGGTIGALPLLVGLAAIVAIAAVVLKHKDTDGEINLPISP